MGFLCTWKKCFSWVWQPSADSNGSLGCFKFENVHQMAITIYRGLSRPTRSLSKIVCRGQEGPKVSKGTLRPDFQTNTRPRFFFKAQDTGRHLLGYPGVVSFIQFWVNDVWTVQGQERPLMNKKGVNKKKCYVGNVSQNTNHWKK